MRKTLLLLAVCACALSAQPNRSYRVDTVAGTLPEVGEIPATSAIVYNPQALAVGKDGIYVSDSIGAVRRIAPDGVIHQRPVGSSVTSIAVDAGGVVHAVFGPAYYRSQPDGTGTEFIPPDPTSSSHLFTGIALEADGNVLIADQNASRVLRITPSREVSVVAGRGFKIQLTGAPKRLAVDASNNIYITQTDARLVRISPDGVAKVIAGNGKFGNPVAGSAAVDSPFQSLDSVVVTSGGEVLVADGYSKSVYKVDAQGVLESVVQGMSVTDLALDTDGTLLLADAGKGRIWRRKADGTLTAIAGREQFDGDGGPAWNALLQAPQSVAVDADGALLIADTGNARIRKVSADGIITTTAELPAPNLMLVGRNGDLYLVAGGIVRRRKADGAIETVAGTGGIGDPGDGGPATAATFQIISGLAVARDGSLYISDSGTQRVRVVRPDGVISTYAGNGQWASAPDGSLAAKSPLSNPTRILVDSQDNLVIFESGAYRLRRVSPEGVLSTWVSTSPLGKPGNSLAETQCRFGTIKSLAFDTDGSLLVSGNTAVCRLALDGTSWLIAGGQNSGFAGDGSAALSAKFRGIAGLAVSPSGAIFVADSGNHRIRKLEPVASLRSPAIAPNGIVGAGGSGIQSFSPGGFASIFGGDFAADATSVAVRASDLVNGVLPTKLADTCVEVNDTRAFLTYVSPGQINFQMPDVPFQSVPVKVVANCGKADEVKSTAALAQVQAASPEFLYWTVNSPVSNPVVALNAATGAYIGPQGLIPGLSFTPAKPGDVLTIYCISLGSTNPPIAPGRAAAASATTAYKATVTFDNYTRLDAANLLYVGASPGTAGLYQINLKVPELPDGIYDMRIALEDSSARKVYTTMHAGTLSIRK